MSTTAERMTAAERIAEKLKEKGIGRKKLAEMVEAPADRVYKVLGQFTTGNAEELAKWEAAVDSYAEGVIFEPRKPGSDIYRVTFKASGVILGTVFPGKGAYRWQLRKDGKIADSGPCKSYQEGRANIINRAFC